MKTIKYLFVFFFLVAIGACSEDDNIDSSGEDLFPKMENTELDNQLVEMFKEYNTRVEFRYIKNLLPTDWYYITPIKEEFVIPMSQLIVDMWIDPLVDGSSKDFVSVTLPKLLVFVGSPALQLDGSVVLGEAEGGTLIRFTQLNTFDDTSAAWISFSLHTAFHEYAHVIHQRFGFPDEYREVTPDSYTRSGWKILSQREALQKGTVTPYATSSTQEDFVELFAEIIISSDEKLDYYFTDIPAWEGMSAADSDNLNKDNEGRRLLRSKRVILKRFMSEAGLDIDVIREAFQTRLAERTGNNN